MSGFVVVIPARFASQRLPGKPLQDIAGKPMLQHVYERARSSQAAEVVIATDDRRIEDAANAFAAQCCMTSADHQSGTDRLAEVARHFEWDDDQVIVNLQGDEPLMPPELIDQCAGLLDDEAADLGTLASPVLSAADFLNPNVVKVVIDNAGFALYFSRAPIPCARAGQDDHWRQALQHHGIYSYRNRVLQRIVVAEQTDLEKCERLEQLRALGLGMKIKVGRPAERPGPGVDTKEDLDSVVRHLTNREAQ